MSSYCWITTSLTPLKRRRITFFYLMAATILLGLTSRHTSVQLPSFFRLYVGDALWALMVFGIVGFLHPSLSINRKALCSLFVCFGIEVSQLYHAYWIDSIRETRIGGLVLGYGFLWSDLFAYSSGVLVGGIIEILIWVKKQ